MAGGARGGGGGGYDGVDGDVGGVGGRSARGKGSPDDDGLKRKFGVLDERLIRDYQVVYRTHEAPLLGKSAGCTSNCIVHL